MKKTKSKAKQRALEMMKGSVDFFSDLPRRRSALDDLKEKLLQKVFKGGEILPYNIFDNQKKK